MNWDLLFRHRFHGSISVLRQIARPKERFPEKPTFAEEKLGDSLPSLPRPPHREPCRHRAVYPCCCTGNLEAWESGGDIKPFHDLSLNALEARPPRLNQSAHCAVLRNADWSVDDSSPRHVSRDLPENAPRRFDIKRDLSFNTARELRSVLSHPSRDETEQ
jgi:hypothetical protein